MPFCIIFFAVAILYLLMFKKVSFKNILLVLCLITLISSAFTGNILIYNNVNVNILFIISIILLEVVILSCHIRNFWLFGLIIVSTTLVYTIGVESNIFLSIDYNFNFALIISILFIIIFSQSLPNILCFVLNYIVGITIADCIFWWKELQVVDINYINIYNLFAAMLLCGFVFNFVYNKAIIRGHKYDKIK